MKRLIHGAYGVTVSTDPCGGSSQGSNPCRHPMKLILGSSSKFRQKVLEEAGMKFEVTVPEINEKLIRSEDFYKLPLLIAREKMAVVRAKVSGPGIIVTADQVVVCDGELKEKPLSREEAMDCLKKYSEGYPAETVSALVIHNLDNGKTAEGVDIAKTFFDPIPDAAILTYVNSGEAYLSAGSFDHEHPALAPHVRSIEGTSDSVSGMPLKLFNRLLEEVTT